MRLINRLVRGFAVGVAASALVAGPALAIAIVPTPATLTVGGATYQVTGCTYSVALPAGTASVASTTTTTSATACISDLGLTMTANASNTGVVFASSSTLATASSPGSGTFAQTDKGDITLNLTITAAGSVGITGINASANGSTTGSGSGYGESITGGVSLTVNQAAPTGAVYFNAVNSLSLVLDLSASAVGNQSGSSTLNNVTIAGLVPEPASMAVVAMALGALGMVRRRRIV